MIQRGTQSAALAPTTPRPSPGQALVPSRLRRALTSGTPQWLAAWAVDRAKKALLPQPAGERHLLFAVCDHYEPLHGRATMEVGRERVRVWREGYPLLARRFRDSNGRSPRHTFFYPGEEYDPSLVEPLAEMVEDGLGEVEVHLHHDGDTRATLREKLERTLSVLASHGVIARRGGAPAWSFIHGNWALANGRPDGRWCGVDDELALLHEMGCYADFTFPSAPDPCQPHVVNAIYYPRDEGRRGYDEAERARVGSAKRDRVLMIEGPLALARRHGGKPGASAVRIEGGALDHGDPPSAARLATWVAQWIHVGGRPEWTFVKVHAHGAPEKNSAVMLGEPMADLHQALVGLAAAGYRLHYVSAREMYNVARAAMDRRSGSPAAYFDYEVPPPERACAAPT